MRPPILIALAVVLGATLWLSSQTDDTVEAVKGGERPSGNSGQAESADRGSAGPVNAARPPRGNTQARTAAGMGTSADAGESWEHRLLIQGVGQWRQRQADGLQARPTGMPSPWVSVQPPPPPMSVAVAPPAPPPPVAPPFPHKWIGRFNDEAEPAAPGASATASAVKPAIQRAVLAGPVSTWVVREGDVIERQWRVDQIQDRTMSLTYLPLQQRQTVVMK